jgi:hypothetical protein
MLVITEAQYGSLLATAGHKLTRVVPTASVRTVFEVKRPAASPVKPDRVENGHWNST